MATGRLPDHEQRILQEMERALRRDRRLARRLRRLSRPNRRTRMSRLVSCTSRPWSVALLLAVSTAFMVAGIVTSQPGVIWAFAAVWPLTLYAAFRLLCRWTEP
jgi:ferric-dicitrate binding protein FerR (iron transport regulator)